MRDDVRRTPSDIDKGNTARSFTASLIFAWLWLVVIIFIYLFLLFIIYYLFFDFFCWAGTIWETFWCGRTGLFCLKGSTEHCCSHPEGNQGWAAHLVISTQVCEMFCVYARACAMKHTAYLEMTGEATFTARMSSDHTNVWLIYLKKSLLINTVSGFHPFTVNRCFFGEMWAWQVSAGRRISAYCTAIHYSDNHISSPCIGDFFYGCLSSCVLSLGPHMVKHWGLPLTERPLKSVRVLQRLYAGL